MNEAYRQKQLEYGLSNENKILLIIQDVFSKSIKRSKYKYSKYDYYDVETKYIFELKTRRIRHDQYPTALLNACKINYKNLIVIYEYTDGLFYIEYDNELFKSFTSNLQRVNNYSQLQEVINIPYKYLIKFTFDDNIKLTAKYDTTDFLKLIQEDDRLFHELNIIKTI
jgi:hypothetical protein